MKVRDQGGGIVTSLKIKPELDIESGEIVRRIRGNECRSKGAERVKESSNAKSRSRKSTPTKARTESSEQNAGRARDPERNTRPNQVTFGSMILLAAYHALVKAVASRQPVVFYGTFRARARYNTKFTSMGYNRN